LLQILEQSQTQLAVFNGLLGLGSTHLNPRGQIVKTGHFEAEPIGFVPRQHPAARGEVLQRLVVLALPLAGLGQFAQQHAAAAGGAEPVGDSLLERLLRLIIKTGE
jgi:hypothetical protein